MAGPQEHRLARALSGAESGIIDGGADAWQTCASLLRNVAANLATTSLPVPSGDAGAETAAAMNAAFKRSAKAMEERAAKLVAGHGALVDAARAIEDARSAHRALGAEESAPTYTPHADPGSRAGIKAHNAFLAKQAAFEADQQHRERVCQQQADHMDRTFARSSAVMKQIHGEKPPAATGGGGGGAGTGSGSTYAPHTATRTSSTYTPGGGGGQHVSGTVHHPAADGGGSQVDYTAGPGGSAGGGHPTGGGYPTGGGSPTGGGAAQGGVTLDPAGTGTGGGGLPGPVTTGAPGGGLSSTNGLGVAGAAAGGIGGGLLGTGLASGGLRGGMPSLVSSSGTAASGVRGIGATARTGVSGTIGRAGVTGEPTSSTAGRAGAGGVRAGAGSSTSARSGTGRGSASRGSAGGRGAGSTAGGRGSRGKDERKRTRQDAFDLAEDEWLDEDEAAPGVLD